MTLAQSELFLEILSKIFSVNVELGKGVRMQLELSLENQIPSPTHATDPKTKSRTSQPQLAFFLTKEDMPLFAFAFQHFEESPAVVTVGSFTQVLKHHMVVSAGTGLMAEMPGPSRARASQSPALTQHVCSAFQAPRAT